MRFIFSYLKKYIKVMTIGLGIKLLASIGELLIPYVLEHIIDEVVPTKMVWMSLLWGG